MVGTEELQVQDGKVTMSSEELAKAIQEKTVDTEGEEEAEGWLADNGICTISQ